MVISTVTIISSTGKYRIYLHKKMIRFERKNTFKQWRQVSTYTNQSAFKIQVWPTDLKYNSGYTHTLDRNFKTLLKDRGKRYYIM